MGELFYLRFPTNSYHLSTVELAFKVVLFTRLGSEGPVQTIWSVIPGQATFQHDLFPLRPRKSLNPSRPWWRRERLKLNHFEPGDLEKPGKLKLCRIQTSFKRTKITLLAIPTSTKIDLISVAVSYCGLYSHTRSKHVIIKKGKSIPSDVVTSFSLWHSYCRIKCCFLPRRLPATMSRDKSISHPNAVLSSNLVM